MLIKKTNILLLLLLLSGTAAAQSGGLTDFEYVRRSDARLTGENPAGLHALSLPKISMAEAYFSKSDGNFINWYQSDDSYEAGAITESFFRLNPKTVLYGKINYANFSGKHMGGSAFIDPNERVFDIQEMVDSTRGSKNLENYLLTGAVSVKLSERFALGGRIDYRAANYAKFKDLRHFNKLFDLTAIVGVNYSFGAFFDLGLNYFFRRNMEDFVFSRHGTVDRQYKSLISFGAFYGRIELFGSDGYTDPIDKKPAVGEWNGGSLQLRFNTGKQSVFFNEISFRSGTGYFGLHSPGIPIHLEHRAPMWIYRGNFSFRQGSDLYILTAAAERETLKNYENIYRPERTPGGRVEIIYLGNNPVLSRTTLKSSLGYTANLWIEDHRPLWILKAEANYYSREQKVSLYPYFRRQNLRTCDLNISANRNIIHRQNCFGLFAEIQYGFGDGVPRENGVYANPAETQKEPSDNDAFLFREYEYLTASRIRGNLGFILTRTFAENLKGYIRANYAITKASGVEYLSGSSFQQAIIAVGCEF